jgi:hypothetical protein
VIGNTLAQHLPGFMTVCDCLKVNGELWADMQYIFVLVDQCASCELRGYSK